MELSPFKKIESGNTYTKIEVTEDGKNLEGHFGIVPLNAIISLAKQGLQKTVRASLSETLKPGDVCTFNQHTGSLIMKIPESPGAKLVGSIKTENQEVDVQDVQRHMVHIDNGVTGWWKIDVNQKIPHRKPYLLVEKYHPVENKSNPEYKYVLSRGTYHSESPFNAPQSFKETSLYNVGQLAEFGAQSEALRLNLDSKKEQVVPLLNEIRIDILNENIQNLQEGDKLECRSIGTPTKLDPRVDEKQRKLQSQCVVLLKTSDSLIPLIKLTIIATPFKQKIAEKMFKLPAAEEYIDLKADLTIE